LLFVILHFSRHQKELPADFNYKSKLFGSCFEGNARKSENLNFQKNKERKEGV